MTTRLALRAVLLLAAFIACVAMAALFILGGIAAEIADDIRASRNEHRTNRGTMPLPRNRKVKDYDSTIALRAANDVIAARHAETTVHRAMLSDARQLGEEFSIPARRSA